MQELKVLEGAEEFSFGSGPVGALLIHGFTGSPQSMRPLGDYLGANGVGGFGLRLPGHGTTWQDLNSRTSDEWRAAADAALSRVEGAHDEVFVIGLSFGGALALDLAARHPDRIAGVVGLSTFLQTPDPKRFLAPVLRYVAKSIPGVGNDICDPDARELCYDRFPTGAGYSMLRFTRGVRERLPDVTSPVLLIHSRNDHTAHPSNARLVYERVSSADKELVWLDRSYHVITLDLERDEVCERTLGFIRERAKSAV